MLSARWRAYFMLLLVAAIWGFATPIIKYAFDYLSPALFLTYRFFITSLVMIPILILTQPDTFNTLGQLSFADWGHLILGGFLGSTLQLGLLFWGLNLTSSLDASLINATSPILVAIAGFTYLQEKITSREKWGLVVAFLGTLIIVLQPLWEGSSLSSGSILGNLLVLAGTAAWVAYVV